MPYRRKDSLVWWASYADASGKRIRRTTGTTDKKEAIALESKWKLGAFQEKQWDKKPERTFDEMMLAYLKAIQGEKRSEVTLHFHAKNLYRHLSGIEMGQVGSKDIRGFIQARKIDGVAPATINRELSLLSAAINYANREWEWTIPNPVTGRKLKEPEGRLRWLTETEARLLIAVALPHLADFITLAIHTGCRLGELLGLEWNRVDLNEELFYLEGIHTKPGKRRSVPINQKAKEAILNRFRFRAEHCPDSQWVFAHRNGQRIQSVKKSFKTACDKVGIQDFRIHDLRHTCATWLLQKGASLSVVKEMLGHSTIRMTERYAHVAPDQKREAASLLDGSVSRFSHGAVDHQRKSG